MKLTSAQYAFLLSLAQSIPRTFGSTDQEIAEDEAEAAANPLPAPPTPTPATPAAEKDDSTTVDLYPELPRYAHGEDGKDVPLWSSLELVFGVKSINLELISGAPTTPKAMKDASLARFALNETGLKVKMVSDGSIQADLQMLSFTIRDTHASRSSLWRDIIPAAKHGGHQLMVSYTMTGGASRSAVAIVTIDTPPSSFP